VICVHPLPFVETNFETSHNCNKCALIVVSKTAFQFYLPFFNLLGISLHSGHILMILHINIQCCPPQNSIGQQSHVCQASCQTLCFASKSPDSSFCCKTPVCVLLCGVSLRLCGSKLKWRSENSDPTFHLN
jgi:hypothetical protein